MLESKANKKKELHLELLYSPDLSFYKQTEQYQNFVELQWGKKN
jgi:hypothetical protein